MTWFRLAFRLQRSSIVFVTVVCLGLAAAALWLTADMREALARCGTPSAPEACDVIYAFQSSHGDLVYMTQWAIGLAPFLVGLVLGVPLVTQEVEHRTALLAWPLAGSRLRWLAWRVVPVLVIGFVLVAVLAVAGDQLARAYLPHGDIGFVQYEGRGVPLVMRAALVIVLGIALGALIGRLLPALLVGIALCAVLSAGLSAVLASWVAPGQLTEAESPFSGPGSLPTELRYRMDGEWIDDEEAELMIMEAYQAAGEGEPDPATLPQEVFYGIAASRYPEVVVRESLALAGGAVVLGAFTVLVVRRRRPE